MTIIIWAGRANWPSRVRINLQDFSFPCPFRPHPTFPSPFMSPPPPKKTQSPGRLAHKQNGHLDHTSNSNEPHHILPVSQRFTSIETADTFNKDSELLPTGGLILPWFNSLETAKSAKTNGFLENRCPQTSVINKLKSQYSSQSLIM